ncbi:MAG TPA: radical SAM protein [Verrucomicrobiae bacterium]|nr:radical SAM protein [Verrucomicrobiae bacterium]
MHPLNRVTVPFFISHRGCPHRCVFCDQSRITGASGDLPDAGAIGAAVRSYRSSVPVEVAFFGGSFTALPQGVQLSLLEGVVPLREEGAVASLRVSTRPDAVSAENLSLLRRYGVETVELGVQSMRDEVLVRSGRSYRGAEVSRAVSLLREAGMRVGAQLMVGLPGDDASGALESLRRVLDLQPDFLRIYPTLVLQGTALEEMLRRGEYLPLTLEEGVRQAAPMLLEALRRSIPVVRLGLQAGKSLESSVVAGPYHPAFRELVEGELFHDLLLRMAPRGEPLRVLCNPRKVSVVVGQRRNNLRRWAAEGVIVASVAGDPAIATLDVQVCAPDTRWRGSLLDAQIDGGRSLVPASSPR